MMSPGWKPGYTEVRPITFHPKALKQSRARQVFWLPCADAFPSAGAESGLECRLLVVNERVTAAGTVPDLHRIPF